MRPRISFIVALALALALPAHEGRAQNVPAVSADVASGGGATSTHAGGEWFLAPYAHMLTADIAVRIGGAGATRPVVLLGDSFDIDASIVSAVCVPAPNGSCRVNFPSAYGPSLGLGLQQALGRWLLIGVGAGVASYNGPARFAEADASLRLAPHFAVVGEFRYIDMPVAGERVWFTPLTFGARFYW